MIQFRRKKRSKAKDVAKGLAAGLAATWLMERVTTWMYENEPKRVRKVEDKLRRGATPRALAAKKAASAGGRKLTKKEAEWAGTALQWGFGLGAAAGYALLRRRLPPAGLGGLLYGTLAWALIDEGAKAALGLSAKPGKFPWQTRARGLAGHLAFGVAADRTLRVLERVR